MLSVVLGFTGIDSVYEPPLNPDLVLKAGETSVQECVGESSQPTGWEGI